MPSQRKRRKDTCVKKLQENGVTLKTEFKKLSRKSKGDITKLIEQTVKNKSGKPATNDKSKYKTEVHRKPATNNKSKYKTEVHRKPATNDKSKYKTEVHRKPATNDKSKYKTEVHRKPATNDKSKYKTEVHRKPATNDKSKYKTEVHRKPATNNKSKQKTEVHRSLNELQNSDDVSKESNSESKNGTEKVELTDIKVEICSNVDSDTKAGVERQKRTKDGTERLYFDGVVKDEVDIMSDCSSSSDNDDFEPQTKKLRMTSKTTEEKTKLKSVKENIKQKEKTRENKSTQKKMAEISKVGKDSGAVKGSVKQGKTKENKQKQIKTVDISKVDKASEIGIEKGGVKQRKREDNKQKQKKIVDISKMDEESETGRVKGSVKQGKTGENKCKQNRIADISEIDQESETGTAKGSAKQGKRHLSGKNHNGDKNGNICKPDDKFDLGHSVPKKNKLEEGKKITNKREKKSQNKAEQNSKRDRKTQKHGDCEKSTKKKNETENQTSEDPVITATVTKIKEDGNKESYGFVPPTNIDQSDVMSVLLHMEGLSNNKPGSSQVMKTDHHTDEEIMTESEEDSEWEEVADVTGEKSPVKSQIPSAPVEITLEAPNFLKKRKKKEFDWKAYVQRQINRFQREVREDIHKVHLMCLLVRGRYLNGICNDSLIHGAVLSMLPDAFLSQTKEKYSITFYENLMKWYRETFTINLNRQDKDESLSVDLIKAAETREASNHLHFVLLFLAVLRCIGSEARLITSLQPVRLKNSKQESSSKMKIKGNPAAIKRKSKSEKGKSNETKERPEQTNLKKKSKDLESKKPDSRATSKTANEKNKLKTKNKNLRQRGSKVKPPNYCDESGASDSDDDFIPVSGESHSEDEDQATKSKLTSGQKAQKKIKKSKQLEYSDDSEFEDECVTYRSPNLGKKTSATKPNRKVLSSDSEGDSVSSASAYNEWIEVYDSCEDSWICVDCVRGHTNRPYRIESAASQPVHYVIAYNTDGLWKDVTAWYASKWMTDTRKLRVDPEWWEETLSVYKCQDDQAEDEAIKANLINRPLPASIAAFKNHPLYVLRRHLLKFEAIYPDTAIPVGYVRGEPVYARECVHVLHSRENWLKEGRAVRIGEEPYKMVKSRPKWKKPKADPDALDLETFGLWQTEVYIPPPAVNGKVPRNEYGNVELFKPSMLPAGTVHLKVPGLNKVAKKMDIDCVPAMVGWDTHCGFSHPVLDGFIVCEEHKDILLAAWDEEQEIQKQKEAEKKEKRAFGNWKLLIKGILIKERLKKRFDLQEKDEEIEEKVVKRGKKATDAKNAWPRRQQDAEENKKGKSNQYAVETI